MYVIQQATNVILDAQLALSTSPALVNTVAGAPTRNEMQGVIFTNNDASITIYLGFNSSISGTRFVKSLAPGAQWEELMNKGMFNQIYAVAASGTPELNIAIFV